MESNMDRMRLIKDWVSFHLIEGTTEEEWKQVESEALCMSKENFVEKYTNKFLNLSVRAGEFNKQDVVWAIEECRRYYSHAYDVAAEYNMEQAKEHNKDSASEEDKLIKLKDII